jgi:hypothetical protein
MLRTIFAPWLAVYDLAAELKAEQRAVKRLEALVVDQAKQLNDARRRIAADEAQINEWGARIDELKVENRALTLAVAKFDHDGDGKPGGRKLAEITYSADGNANNAYNPPRRRAQS